MNKYNVIGVMSGTSLDGIDVVYTKLSFKKKWFYKILACETFQYSEIWINKLIKAHTARAREFIQLDHQYGNYVGEIINKFLKKNKIKKSDVDLISSHGHTIFHEPKNMFTYQIGNGNQICAVTNIKTITDFRSLDVAFGGQGAPLVPIGDELLFKKYAGCLNLGGIANISFNSNNQRLAGDLNFANMISNYLSKKIGHLYDKDGNLAQKGKLDESLIAKLENLSFYKKIFPKSLSIEDFNNWYKPIYNNSDSNLYDQLYTAGVHLSRTIKNTFEINENSELFITGGGAYNKFWIQKINELNIKTVIPEENMIEFKEALIFSLLGVLKIRNENNILSSVTGASKDLSAGVLFIP